MKDVAQNLHEALVAIHAIQKDLILAHNARAVYDIRMRALSEKRLAAVEAIKAFSGQPLPPEIVLTSRDLFVQIVTILRDEAEYQLDQRHQELAAYKQMRQEIDDFVLRASIPPVEASK